MTETPIEYVQRLKERVKEQEEDIKNLQETCTWMQEEILSLRERLKFYEYDYSPE